MLRVMIYAVVGAATILIPTGLLAQAELSRSAPDTKTNWHAARRGLGVGRIAFRQSLNKVRDKTTKKSPFDNHVQRVASETEPGSGRSAASDLPISSQTIASMKHAGYRDEGQVWREFDIRSYTLRVASTSRPQQAIIDWIFRETGSAVWHGGIPAVLSADRSTLRVYHVPSIQNKVADIVGRFTEEGAEPWAIDVNILGIKNPDWRKGTLPMMTPLLGSQHGVQVWLMEREDVSLLREKLSKRRDYRLHRVDHMPVYSGQAQTLRLTRPKRFVRDIERGDFSGKTYRPVMDQIEEGLVLELTSLKSSDGNSLDVTSKFHLSQVDSLRSVEVDIPISSGTRSVATVQVPQVIQQHFEEEFTWPVGKVLVLSFGMTGSPIPSTARRTLYAAPRRQEVLVFLNVSAPMLRQYRRSGGEYSSSNSGGAGFRSTRSQESSRTAASYRKGRRSSATLAGNDYRRSGRYRY